MDRSTGNTYNVSKKQNTPGIERRWFRPYPKYKDSGVEWLGKIPIYWDVKPFKALLSRNDGGVWGEDFADDGVIVLRSTEQTVDGKWNIESPAKRQLTTREASDARLEVGDLVVTKSSGSELHLGKTSIVDQPVAALNCCFSNFMQRLRVAWPNLSRYYWYLLNCPVAREQLIFLSSTTTGLGNLNGSILGSIRVPVAPEDEQQAIANFLDRETVKIDALIEKKERLIELLQEKRTALITRAVTKGLDPTVPMKDSGIEWLGEIPTHWALVPLKSLTLARPGSIKTGPFGSQLLASDMAQEEIKVYNQRNVIAHDFTAGENYISMSKFRELASFEVFKNDILVTTRGTIGKSAIVPNGAERGILHPCLLRIQPDSDKIKIAYLALIIQESNLVINQLALASNATTIDVIYSDTIGRVLIPCPPMNEQSAIFEFLDGMTAKIDALKSSIQEAIASLREYRTALISAAVTGKIDVREA